MLLTHSWCSHVDKGISHTFVTQLCRKLCCWRTKTGPSARAPSFPVHFVPSPFQLLSLFVYCFSSVCSPHPPSSLRRSQSLTLVKQRTGLHTKWADLMVLRLLKLNPFSTFVSVSVKDTEKKHRMEWRMFEKVMPWGISNSYSSEKKMF